MCALVQDADSQDSRCHVRLGSPCHPCRALHSLLCRRRCNRLECNVESSFRQILWRCELSSCYANCLTREVYSRIGSRKL